MGKSQTTATNALHLKRHLITHNGEKSDLVSATGIEIPPCRKPQNIMLHFNWLRMFNISSMQLHKKRQLKILSLSGISTRPVKLACVQKPQTLVLFLSFVKKKESLQKIANYVRFQNYRIDLAKAIISFIVPFMAGFLFIDC